MPRHYRTRNRAARTIQRVFRGFRGRRVGAALRRTRWNRPKRVQQNIGRLVQYFKNTSSITSTNTGDIFFQVAPTNITSAGDFSTYATLYGEYKVLRVTAKFFPTSVGSESLSTAAGAATFKRGDTCTYITSTTPLPSPQAIDDVLNKSSCRIIMSRKYHKRWIDRPPGYPTWGTLDTAGVPVTPDPWRSGINMFGDNYTPVQAPGPQTFWYVLITYKVLFRSRRE